MDKPQTTKTFVEQMIDEMVAQAFRDRLYNVLKVIALLSIISASICYIAK